MGTSALTVKSNNGLLRQLSSPVDIIVPNTETRNQYYVDNLRLIPTGMSIVNTAGGQVKQNTYIVDISLNAGITLKDVTVTCAEKLSGGCNVLIGMDIINQGDFSITNKNGTTCMSFRVPSMHEIDFCKNPNMKANSNPNRGSNLTPPKKKRKK